MCADAESVRAFSLRDESIIPLIDKRKREGFYKRLFNRGDKNFRVK